MLIANRPFRLVVSRAARRNGSAGRTAADIATPTLADTGPNRKWKGSVLYGIVFRVTDWQHCHVLITKTSASGLELMSLSCFPAPMGAGKGVVMFRSSFLVASCLALCAVCTPLHAQVARTLAMQGVLTDPVGHVKPDGAYTLTFRLYNVASGGAALWTEADIVTATGGRFGTALGTVTAIPDTIYFSDQTYYLGVQISGEAAEMTPRIPLRGVPLALALPGFRTEIASVSPNVIGGLNGNFVTAGVHGSTVAGGGVGGFPNRVTDNYGFVGGGTNNVAGNSGGTSSDSEYAVAVGGVDNSATGAKSTVGGGRGNVASGLYGTVPGGSFNTAAGSSSFAAGNQAKANHAGSFVWGDSQVADFASTGVDQFVVRAAGGVGIGTNAPGAKLHVSGTTPSGLALDVNERLFVGSSFVGVGRSTTVSGAEYFGVLAPVSSGFGGMYIQTQGAAGLPFYGYSNQGGGVAYHYLDGADNNTWKLDNGGVRLAVTSTGRVGVGNTDPQTPLDVSGTIRTRSGGIRFPDDTIQTTAAAGSAAAWSLAGNTSTTPGTNFLGTTDNKAFVVKVNSLQALRITPAISGVDSTWAPNLVGGADINSVTATRWGSTIGGGRDNVVDATYGTIGGGGPTGGGVGGNRVYSAFGTVSGGSGNVAGPIAGQTPPNPLYATVAGGFNNEAETYGSNVSGGAYNLADGETAVVAGGTSNHSGGISAAIGGGYGNAATGDYAVVSGGSQNFATASDATVPGGYNNQATGTGSFAAGMGARATHSGSFVWADSTAGTFASSNNNEFNIRATGGIRIFTNSQYNSGVTVHSGDSTWNSLSDRNAKTNFRSVDTVELLDRLAAIPISAWNYKANTDIRHIGPMAQDFYTAFGGLGLDDKHISTVDADGVAMAAIQGLYHVVKDKEAQLTAQQKRIASLEARLEALEKRLPRNR